MKIYIYQSANGTFGRNNNGAYMTESQVLDNDSFIYTVFRVDLQFYCSFKIGDYRRLKVYS